MQRLSFYPISASFPNDFFVPSKSYQTPDPFFVQIETGSGDKQTNINLVSREDFERLKNFQEPETNGVVSPEVCFCSAGPVELGLVVLS